MSAGLRERLLEAAEDIAGHRNARPKDYSKWWIQVLREVAAALDGQGDAAEAARECEEAILGSANSWADRALKAESELAALKAAGDAAPRVAASPWQPIETAPKDSGKRCLFVDEHGERFVAFWSIRWECWLTTPSGPDGAFGNATKPTGWMPISDPPATSGSGDEAQSESSTQVRVTKAEKRS